ncbi:MAG: LpxL/LpxP family Kdo(2)-lipid IV(A) lauroyl/palmitoleoyl acyltransferase [Pseudomonadota bacterium]|uniref:Lipid A biosynthesis acyltransferase n=1 Tax=Methylophaga thalassica TaxID=40223 RepID=A0ABQ5TVI2_9GAMM|nr:MULTISPECIES: LpxL/LpxP family Kdo(2)-lipid IV(A) lauroyl/palmitoleoyl acyltransferase [Methylophaga]MEC9412328.1 LpxL/LpxP family Kdo(2)-lipid IV(A) lauroyl/palmitoleoyl acyltransferase [Pseudomonadota bacterium]WVI85072.1 LpxL/LpxP family Kdo(2)-lipid IV(A) lauroyl/palmitoleoyl acyltransferase [Methylophaga thalassica]GLQ00182.1 lipid A biosynthesis lauroyltransferase [Methylophaga thalassica]HIC46449.1 LpxL/LpxP family Kdo(2)-lipid IV(A) lauroyl/palmitoleoyl acyltransferase [Methylophaga 
MNIFQKQFLHPRFWLSWLGLLLMRLSVYLPAKLQYRIGMLLGQLMQPFMRSRAKVVRRNLELCFPEMSDAEREYLVKKILKNTGMMMIETAISWWASDRQLRRRVTYEGLEHLEAAKAKGKGVILLTGHFTSMEIGGRLIMLQTPAYVMFRHLKNPLFNAVMMRSRIYHSEGIVMRDDVRAMLRALRKNKVVWYAPDQDFGPRNSIFAKFFGVTAATIPATARMVKMTGAEVVPFVPKRNSDGSYHIQIFPAWEAYPSGDDIVDAQRINDWIESQIRQMPEQYFWLHRRFKTQPDGKGRLYKKVR